MVSLLTLPDNIHLPGTPEHFSPLLTSDRGLLVERIVSWGHVTPEGQWYDQEKDERVLHKECYNGILQLRSSLCNTVQNVRQSGL